MKHYTILFILLVCSFKLWAPVEPGVHFEVPGEHLAGEHSGVDLIDPAHEASVKVTGDQGIIGDRALIEAREHDQRLTKSDSGVDFLDRDLLTRESNESLEQAGLGSDSGFGDKLNEVAFQGEAGLVPAQDEHVSIVIPSGIEGDSGKASVEFLQEPFDEITSTQISSSVSTYEHHLAMRMEDLQEVEMLLKGFKKKDSKAIFADYHEQYQVLENVRETLDAYLKELEPLLLYPSVSKESVERIAHLKTMIVAQQKRVDSLTTSIEESLTDVAFNDLSSFTGAVTQILTKNILSSTKLAQRGKELHELRMILERASITAPKGNKGYEESIRNLLELLDMHETNLQNAQLKALEKNGLIEQAKNAVKILKTQNDVRYAASSRGQKELADAKKVLKKLDVILYSDPLYTDHAFDKHSQLSFSLLGEELKKRGLKPAQGQSFDAFLQSQPVKEISSGMFGFNAPPGEWKRSLDYNLALNTRNELEANIKQTAGSAQALRNMGLGKTFLSRRSLQKISSDKWKGKARKSSAEFRELKDASLPSYVKRNSEPVVSTAVKVPVEPVRSRSVPIIKSVEQDVLRKNALGVVHEDFF